MNADGSGQTRLTSDPNDDRAPVWSPDGSRIAFQSLRNGVNYQVYVMNADGSNQVNLSNDSFNDTQPSWSPDGSRIAFASDRDHAGYNSVYAMNSNGTNQTRLTFSAATFTDEQPAWSADGSKIAFTSTRDSTIETWTETDDDGNVITKSKVHLNKEVYLMNSDGSGQTRLTNALENDDSPAWSGDGTRIVFRSERERDCCDPSAQVWMMNSDGSGQLNLSNNGWGDYAPNWPTAGFQASVPSFSGAHGLMWSAAVLLADFSSGFGGSGVIGSPVGSASIDLLGWGTTPASATDHSPVTPSTTWTIQWMVTDQLGTPRMIFDQSGSLTVVDQNGNYVSGMTRHDYLPFGEELGAGTGGRTTAQGYTGDTLRQKFTQKERDNETGLDYFGARYYGSTQGRFTSPDEFLNSGRLESPQTWNRYSYVLNNPLAFTDPTGLYEYADGTSDKDKKRFEEQFKNARAQLDKIKARYGADSAEYKNSKRALDAYGGVGEKNGVTVGFGTTTDHTPGATSGFFKQDGTKGINVTIDMSKNKADNLLLGTIAHEGSHVQDRADLVDGILKNPEQADAVAARLNITVGATETMAYTVQSVFAEFTYKNEQLTESRGGATVFRMEATQESAVIGGTGTKIWNPSWAGADVAKIRSQRSAAIAEGLSKSSLYKDNLNKPILR